LHGVAGGLALPFLPSLATRSARAAAPDGKPPIRLVIAVMPNGLYSPLFHPTLEGAHYDLPQLLAPIAALQDRYTVVTGVDNLSAAETTAFHPEAMGTLMTDATYEPSCPTNGISVDQVAAQHVGGATAFPSLQVSVYNELGGLPDACMGNVSWGPDGAPYPGIGTPQDLFDHLFVTPHSPTTTATLSILDKVATRVTELEAHINSHDKVRLDQYLTAVRELETTLDHTRTGTCPEPDAPPTDPPFDEATAELYDLVNVALQCDLSRIVTFMQGPTTTNEIYTHVGATKGLHVLSHEAWVEEGDSRDQYVACNAWEIERFSAFVTSLAATTDTDGSDLLSNTICVLLSEFGESNQHLGYGPPYSLPILVAGGENAGIVQGLHRVVPGENTGNFFLGLLHHLGIEQDTFGNHGTTPLVLG
jgi:hypothetical protein